MLPQINKQSSEFVQTDPLGWSATRKRQIVAALASDDAEIALDLVKDEILPRIGKDATIAYLGRIFEKEITLDLE